MPALVFDFVARLASLQDSLDTIGRRSETMAKKLDRAFGSVRNTLATLGVALSAGAAANFIRVGIDAADNFGKLSQKIGVSVETLSAFNYAASLSGTNTEQLSTALAMLAKNASDTAANTGEALAAFKALGVAVKDSEGKLRGTDDLLLEIADKFSNLADGSGKTALAMKLFGESGVRLIPFLNQGKAGIEGLRKEAERLGIIISGDTARRAEEFNDNMTKLRASVDGARIAMAQGLLPALTQIAQRMAEAAKNGGPLVGVLEGLRESVTQLFEASKKGQLLEDLDEVQQRIARTVATIQSNKLSVPLFGDVALNDTGRASLFKNLDLDLAKAQELRERIKLLNGEAFDKPTKPTGADAPGITNPADAIAAVRAKAESELKKLADALKSEESAISGSIDILGTMLQQNLISFETYYAERSRLQKEGLDATVAAAQEEIRVAQRLRSQLPKEADRTAQDDKIRDAQNRIEEAQKAFAVTSVKSFYESTQAAQAYAQKLADIAIQIKEIDGDVVGAALGRFGQATRDLQLQAQAKGDTAALGNIDALRQRVAAQAQINALLQQAQIIQEQLANAEARVQNERNLGAASELTGLQKTTAARQEALAQLERIAKAYSDIAAASNNPVLKQQAENFKRQVEDLAASADLVKQKFKQIGEEGLSTFFEDILNGTKSVKEAFEDMGRSILQSVNRLVAQDIASKIFSSFKPSGGGGGSGGGIVEFFGSILSSIFGGPRADGGPVEPGKIYPVGERGPEWFAPRSAGTIIPNGAMGGDINITVRVDGNAMPQTRQSASQLGYALGTRISRDMRRNG